MNPRFKRWRVTQREVVLREWIVYAPTKADAFTVTEKWLRDNPGRDGKVINRRYGPWRGQRQEEQR